jgi:hypothetical protein
VPDSQRRSVLRERRDQVNHLEGVLNDLLNDLEQKKRSGATNSAR